MSFEILDRVRMKDRYDGYKAKSVGTVVHVHRTYVRVAFDKREWERMHGNAGRCWDIVPRCLEKVGRLRLPCPVRVLNFEYQLRASGTMTKVDQNAIATVLTAGVRKTFRLDMIVPYIPVDVSSLEEMKPIKRFAKKHE